MRPPIDDIGPSWYRAVIALLAILLLGFSMIWALVLPPFSGPDELRHYNSVVRVLDGGGWPEPYKAKLLDSTLTAYYESGEVYLDQGLSELPAPEDRSTMLSGREWANTVHDQMVQHPPAYYLVVAGALSLLDPQTLRWDHAQLLMRIASALMVAASLPFLIGIARRVTRSRVAGVAGGAGVFLVPFFSNTGGHIGNDALLILACTMALYFAVRATDGVRAVRWVVVAGIALGIALLVKGFALMLVPVVAVLAVIAAVRAGVTWWRALGIVVLPLAIAFAIGGWWWLRNLVVMGKLQPSILGNRERRDTSHPDYDLSVFVGEVIGRLNRTFWGRGARPEIALPELAVVIAGIVLIVVLVVALVVARRRLVVVLLLAFPVLILATTISNAHAIFWDTGDPYRGVQGRYVFAGIAVWTTSLAIVMDAMLRRSGVRTRSRGAALLLTGGGAVTTAAIWWVTRSLSAPAGISAFVEALDIRHGVAPATLIVVGGATLVVGSAAVAVILLAGRMAQSVGGSVSAIPPAPSEDPVTSSPDPEKIHGDRS